MCHYGTNEPTHASKFEWSVNTSTNEYANMRKSLTLVYKLRSILPQKEKPSRVRSAGEDEESE